MMRRCLAALIGGVLSLALAALMAGPADAENIALTSVSAETLAQGPVQGLPPGKIYINILEWRQQPGQVYAAHSHVPIIVYTVQGMATITYSRAVAVRPGAAIFVPPSPPSPPAAFENLDGRIGAAAIAVALIVLVALLCAATLLRGRARRFSIGVLSILLIAVGTYPLIGASSNDFYVIAVRPDVYRTVPMSRPDGHVFYSSPDIDPVPLGPYVETLVAITVPPGAHFDAPAVSGPQVIVVEAGTAALRIGDRTTQLSGGDGAMAQTGQTVAIVNGGSATLKVLDFAVTSSSASA